MKGSFFIILCYHAKEYTNLLSNNTTLTRGLRIILDLIKTMNIIGFKNKWMTSKRGKYAKVRFHQVLQIIGRNIIAYTPTSCQTTQ